MNNPKVSIIIPTRHRAKLLETRLETILLNTPELKDGTAELIISLDSDDLDTKILISSYSEEPAEVKYPAIQVLENPPLEIPAIKWNNAAKISEGEWLVTLSDDCIPQHRWLTNALRMFTYGFIGLPDGVTGDRNNYFTPLYMATRPWLKQYHGGVLVIPWYKSWYADIETAMRAKRVGHYIVGNNSVVKQLHECFGTADNDEIYRLGETRRVEDLAMYNYRASKNFPDDFMGVL